MPLGKYFCDYCEEFQDTLIYEETPSSKRPTPSSQSSMVRLLQRSQPCLPRELDQRGLQPLCQYNVVVRDHTGTSSSNLPPSLMPPPEGGHPRLPFVGWG